MKIEFEYAAMRSFRLFRTLAQTTLAWALLVVTANLSLGCGAMFNTQSVGFPVQVNPPGTLVYVDGLFAGLTPITIALDQRVGHSIELRRDGFQSQSMRIEPQAAGKYVVLDCVLLLFFILPGVLALVIDSSTGGWKTIEPPGISTALIPGPQVYSPLPPPVQQSPQVQPAPTQSPTFRQDFSGCQNDTQCKGERICREGKCVDPIR